MIFSLHAKRGALFLKSVDLTILQPEISAVRITLRHLAPCLFSIKQEQKASTGHLARLSQKVAEHVNFRVNAGVLAGRPTKTGRILPV